MLIVAHLRKQGVLDAISQQVRFARRRFGRYEVIDFVAVLLGYASSGERTLETFYQRLLPFAAAFMARIARERTLFLADLLARPLGNEQGEQSAGLWDRHGIGWLVFGIDGTKLRRPANVPCHRVQIAPRPERRLRPLCAPGYTGSKRGEVVRTRTTVLHAHTHQWLGTDRATLGTASFGKSCVGP